MYFHEGMVLIDVSRFAHPSPAGFGLNNQEDLIIVFPIFAKDWVHSFSFFGDKLY